ncbi:hypothetical protein [Pseudoxanthomonas sp. LARHCG66]
MSASSSCALRILLAAILVAAGSATWGSDPIHKCRGADGQAHYQAMPCTSTQRTEWVRAYPADPPIPATSASSSSAPRATARADSPRPRSRTGARRRQTSSQGAVISMHRDAAACERAKKARDQAHVRLGLRRDFDTSRRLDDRVNAACR